MEERVSSLERQLQQEQDIINKLLTSVNFSRNAPFVEEAHNPKRVKLQNQIEKHMLEQTNAIADKRKGAGSTEGRNSKIVERKRVKGVQIRKIHKKFED